MPIDGVSDLSGGESGALAGVAALPESKLKVDLLDSPNKYCVVAVGKHIHEQLLNDKGEVDRTILRNTHKTAGKSFRIPEVFDALINHVFFDVLRGSEDDAEERQHAHRVLTIATRSISRRSKNNEGSKGKFIPWFDTLPTEYVRIHRCRGSRIGSLLKALLPDISVDIFVGELNVLQCVFAAIAAESTGGTFFAIPVNAESKGEGYTSNARAWLGPADFVSTDSECFMSVSGLNDSPVLKGVVQNSCGRVVTESIVFNAISRSYRCIRSHHNLEQCLFPRPSRGGGFKAVPLHDALSDLNRKVLKKTGSSSGYTEKVKTSKVE